MRLLLDTHILLWTAGNPERLSPTIRGLLADNQNQLYFSVASAWEIAIKVNAGRLVFPLEELHSTLAAQRLILLDITLPHAMAAAALPPHHNDPFDRMLIAQARMEALLLVTADGMIPTYDVKTLSART
ncbi:type II toxin-antitoxin system VapC family toxin [Niveispirillum sp.]|uniref:type II toxin-antitoxin system VapC family toxin n=1 Tax=Niveispirillum sp. TaxID=1917217 RepID=UPI001B5166D4|nr:type II toxin-antitoxin system VapC family toxin [Niveispirillum sp.]MBP7336792.1 type II toxin-antitoxin system VapC family toxin [Niveispirillum sp.]